MRGEEEAAKRDAVFLAPEKAYQLWQEKPDQVIILDVRTPGKYQNSHVKGARNLDYYANFEVQVEKLPEDRVYSLHCALGQRSGKATTLMHAKRYGAYDAGSFEALAKSGFPAE